MLDRAQRDVPGVGLIEYEQTDVRRTYHFTPEGGERERFPSVTTVLRATWPKPALMRWYARYGADAERMLDEAATRGTSVHRFIERYLATGAFDFETADDGLAGYYQGAARFLLDYDPQPEAIELLVANPDMRYAGRLDLRAMVNGHRAIIDFKSNPKGAVYAEAHVQALAYGVADVLCGAPPADKLYIVGLSEHGDVNVCESRASLKLWRNLRESYDLIAALERDATKAAA
jgi:hypothetical protein